MASEQPEKLQTAFALHQRGRLAALKDRLARNRTSFPLFDTALFTRHIEAAYAEMWRRYRRGEPPRAFAVTPIGEAG